MQDIVEELKMLRSEIIANSKRSEFWQNCWEWGIDLNRHCWNISHTRKQMPVNDSNADKHSCVIQTQRLINPPYPSDCRGSLVQPWWPPDLNPACAWWWIQPSLADQLSAVPLVFCNVCWLIPARASWAIELLYWLATDFREDATLLALLLHHIPAQGR